MKLKMNQKMIIFEKLNHALACTKIVIFTFIFDGQQPYPHAHWAGAFFTMSSMYYVYQHLFLSVQQNIIIYRFTTEQ